MSLSPSLSPSSLLWHRWGHSPCFLQLLLLCAVTTEAIAIPTTPLAVLLFSWASPPHGLRGLLLLIKSINFVIVWAHPSNQNWLHHRQPLTMEDIVKGSIILGMKSCFDFSWEGRNKKRDLRMILACYYIHEDKLEVSMA